MIGSVNKNVCFFFMLIHGYTGTHWWSLKLGKQRLTKFYLKSLNSKTDIYQFFSNLRYLRLKTLKNKENKKKICHIFHNFQNVPCYVMSVVSLKQFYFALFDDGLTLETLKNGVYRLFFNSNSSFATWHYILPGISVKIYTSEVTWLIATRIYFILL